MVDLNGGGVGVGTTIDVKTGLGRPVKPPPLESIFVGMCCVDVKSVEDKEKTGESVVVRTLGSCAVESILICTVIDNGAGTDAVCMDVMIDVWIDLTMEV